mmetsp:Transcript_1754/g.1627  ORF Transcript_1754/g.1627 Transcript_1754/m.1627 type:complete len:211 (+) Transcript_1754:269-901(+)
MISNISAIGGEQEISARDTVAFDVGLGDVNNKISNCLNSYVKNCQNLKGVSQNYQIANQDLIFEYLELGQEKIQEIIKNDYTLAKIKIDLKAVKALHDELTSYKNLPIIGSLLCNLDMIDLFGAEKEGIMEKYRMSNPSYVTNNKNTFTMSNSNSTPNLSVKPMTTRNQTPSRDTPNRTSQTGVPKLRIDNIDPTNFSDPIKSCDFSRGV